MWHSHRSARPAQRRQHATGAGKHGMHSLGKFILPTRDTDSRQRIRIFIVSVIQSTAQFTLILDSSSIRQQESSFWYLEAVPMSCGKNQLRVLYSMCNPGSAFAASYSSLC